MKDGGHIKILSVCVQACSEQCRKKEDYVKTIGNLVLGYTKMAS